MIPRDAKIAAWDRKYGGRHPRWRGPAIHELAIPVGARVLELGCGDGKTLRGLLGRGHETVALDFSRRALLSLEERLARKSETCRVQADGTALPFAPDSFQLVLGHHFFEHLELEERRSSAKEVARVLSPGGRLSVKAFAKRDLREGRGVGIEPSTYLREGIPYHYFDEKELEGLFHELLLDSIRTEVEAKRYGGESRSRAVIHAEFRKGL